MIVDLQTRRLQQVTTKEIHRKQLVKELGEPTSNFFRVSHLTTSNKHFSRLSVYAQLLFYRLCAFRNRYQRSKSYFTRSFRQLKKDTGFSINTLRKAQKELIEARFLVCVSRPGGRTRYQIVDMRQGKSLL